MTNINYEILKHYLVRGKPIVYENIKVYQPTISEIDDILLSYDSYKFIYCASKGFLKYDDGESIDDFKDCTYFQTLFKMKNKLYLQMLILSLEFFLNVKVANDNIRISNDMKIAIVDDEGKNILFTLDDSNFEEFSELIRLICCCEKMKVEEDDEDILKIDSHYSSNPSIQQKYEKLIKQHNKSEIEKKKENSFTLADMIGIISINEKTKYKFEDIDKLTIWQLYYIHNGMFIRESNEFDKMQYCSYKFVIEDKPNFDWSKKAKVKLPKSIIEKTN
jgi:hypothetical protein